MNLTPNASCCIPCCNVILIGRTGEESYVPPASSTIYHYLRLFEYIVPRHPPHHGPLDPVEPLRQWQIDFKDVSSAEANPQGKQQHRLEIFNVVDQGSSFWLHAEVRSGFTAEQVCDPHIPNKMPTSNAFIAGSIKSVCGSNVPQRRC